MQTGNRCSPSTTHVQCGQQPVSRGVSEYRPSLTPRQRYHDGNLVRTLQQCLYLTINMLCTWLSILHLLLKVSEMKRHTSPWLQTRFAEILLYSYVCCDTLKKVLAGHIPLTLSYWLFWQTTVSRLMGCPRSNCLCNTLSFFRQSGP